MPSRKGGMNVQLGTATIVNETKCGVNDDDFTTVSSRRHRRAERRGVRHSKSNHQPSTKSIHLMDQVIDSVASQSHSQSHSQGQGHKKRPLLQSSGSSDSSSSDDDDDYDINSFQSTAAGFNVHAEINRLQKLVNTLQNKVEFLLSFLGVNESPPPDAASHSNDSNTNVQSGPSYATVAANGLHKLQGPVRNAVLTAVYSDLQARESMKNNVVVCGLPPNTDQSDNVLFAALCRQHLGFSDGAPTVARTTRLGRPSPDRVQPLLVALTNQEDKNYLLTTAKNLRKSTDVFVRNNIYISPQQTRAERQAAYESRCRRRQARPSADRPGRSQPRLPNSTVVAVEVRNEPKPASTTSTAQSYAGLPAVFSHSSIVPLPTSSAGGLSVELSTANIVQNTTSSISDILYLQSSAKTLQQSTSVQPAGSCP